MSLRSAPFVASSALFTFLVTSLGHSAPPSPGVLIVANQKEHTVLLVDPEARRELAKITVGVNGHEVAVSPDSRFAYVPIYGNSGVGRPGTDGATIDIIDLQQRKLAATMDLGKPLRPHQPQFGPDGLLYVSAELANAVDIIDPASRKIIAEAPTGQPESHMFVLSKDARRAYTSNVHAGTVSVVDIANRTIAIDLKALKVLKSFDVPQQPGEILIRPDAAIAYITCMPAGKIAVLDLRTWQLQPTIDLTPGVDGMAWSAN